MDKKKKDNEFKFIGVLVELGEIKEGETSHGPWQNQRFKVQEYGEYAQTVEFTAFGNTVEQLREIPLKTDVEVEFTITGRSTEKDGKKMHFNTLRASIVKAPHLEQKQKETPKKQEVFNKPDDMPF